MDHLRRNIIPGTEVRFENNSVIFGETHMHSLSHTQRQLVRAGCDGVNVDVLKVHITMALFNQDS